MTGRVCPVHGEYAADGICRWCEPKTLLDVAMSGPKVRPLPVAQPTPWAANPMPTGLPVGSVPCRCGEYSWLPECLPDMREGVIAGMFHSPAQCFKLDAEAPPTTYETTFTLIEQTTEAYVWRLEWTEGSGIESCEITEPSRSDDRPVCLTIGPQRVYLPTAADLPIQPPVVLEYQHAALRWERVARRWATKAKFDGHETTVDGTLVFDDRCAECRRTKRLTDAGIPKEWP